jgi:oxysterol-binding protein-related protein 3/6/7
MVSFSPLLFVRAFIHYPPRDKPSSSIRNIISGKDKYFEHVGPMTIENARTGSYVDVKFKEATLWNMKNKNAITGTIFSSSDVPQGTLDGTWDHEVHFTPDQCSRRTIWTAKPFPPNAPQYYGFTYFATGLNELTPELAASLPPTDSRWRPDQRLMEDGKLEEAEAEKARLEEAQRDRRYRGVDAQPRWFEKVSDSSGDEEGQEWVFKKTYWSARETKWVAEGEPLW